MRTDEQGRTHGEDGRYQREYTPAKAVLLEDGRLRMKDSQNRALDITRGKLDANGKWLFTGGQCVAFAEAAAAHVGVDHVEIEIRGDGLLQHAYIRFTENGQELVADANGIFTAEAWEARRWMAHQAGRIGEHRKVPLSELRTQLKGKKPGELGHMVKPQEFDFATEFMDAFDDYEVTELTDEERDAHRKRQADWSARGSEIYSV